MDEGYRVPAAYLVLESLPLYYQVPGMNNEDMAACVAESLGQEGGELGRGLVALHKNLVAGVLTYISGEKLTRARLVSTHFLLRHLSESSSALFREHLKTYHADFGEIPKYSLYISRFTVGESYRGSGIADRIMKTFLSLVESSSQNQNTASLHVDKHNERAIAFYRKHDFRIYEKDSYYRTMIYSC